MAPEQIERDAHTTDRSDIWSLAATLLHAWHGYPPWGPGTNVHHAMQCLAQKRKPPLSPLPPRSPHEPQAPPRPLPPVLRTALDWCFRIEPSERPSAAVLFKHLCDIKGQILRQGVRCCVPYVPSSGMCIALVCDWFATDIHRILSGHLLQILMVLHEHQRWQFAVIYIRMSVVRSTQSSQTCQGQCACSILGAKDAVLANVI